MASATLQIGEILSDAVYQLDEFSRRTGLKKQALRTARSNGLAVRYIHGRAYVYGRDWVEYIASVPTTEDHTSTNES